jgi:carbamoylphosphate synthase small subunit
MPDKSSFSPTPRSATTAPTRQTTSRPRPYIEGLIVREFSPISSNWRSEQVTDEYMERYSVPVLAEIDTRALVRHLRTHGVMRGVISTDVSDPDALVAKARAIRKMDGTDLAQSRLHQVHLHLRRHRQPQPVRRCLCCPKRSVPHP